MYNDNIKNIKLAQENNEEAMENLKGAIDKLL